MKRVLHLLRKNTQLNASFIFNQVNSHIDFEPFIVFIENRQKQYDGGFAKHDIEKYKYLDLSNELKGIGKIRYRLFKKSPRSALIKLKNFIRVNNIEILHFHYGTDCGVYYPLLKNINIPSIVSFYGYDCSSFPKSFFGFGRTYLYNRVFKHVTKVLAMSENMKGDLLEIGCPEKKVEVHYYGTDTSFFNFDKSYKSKEKVTLLILASLVPKKGHLFLLKSIRELIKNNITNFKLRIVGTGELEGELKRFVSEANMDEYVDFEGVIAYGSMEWLNEYKFADVFIHPSVTPQDGDKEGIPGTIIEAMASGLPVIATYHAGIPHIIKNDVTGLLVKENSVKDLTSAIRSLITDPNKRKRIGLAGKDHAITKLDLKEKEKELERIYCSLIGS